jgi:nicotinate-nucleotide--dimethylbenzimidazole phosphoribosyltransferase
MDSMNDLDELRQLVKRLPVRRIDMGRAEHPRLALFAAARDAVEAALVAESLSRLSPESEFGRAVESVDADLRVYELDLEHPAGSLDEKTAVHTAAYGMTAIEPGPDLFCIAAMEDAPTVLPAVTSGLATGRDPLELMMRHGGRDTVCLVGALVATRMAALPVILDGAQAMAAASIVHALAPHAVSHCLVPRDSRIEALAATLGIPAIPYSGGGFPLSLAHAIEAIRAHRHGLA